MFSLTKYTIPATLLIFSLAASAFDFDLKIPVNRNGDPDPGGIPFEQYFVRFASDNAVVCIDRHKYIFWRNLSCNGIRKNHSDAINWEIEKTLRCYMFKLNQIKTVSRGYIANNTMFDFLQFSPGTCDDIAPALYLWLQTDGRGLSSTYNLWEIMDKAGNTGKKYAKRLEEDGLRPRFAPPAPSSDILGNYANLPFEKLVSKIGRTNPGININIVMAYQPEIEHYGQAKIMQMLELKTPPEIVKYLLANNMIRTESFNWLVSFLGMCQELPPEAVEFLKKQYLDSDPKYKQMIRDKIVVASFRNPEMSRWLKPYMAEFIANGKVSSRAAVAYMLITGESDPVRIVSNYVYDPNNFIYEYALATGKYSEAFSLIEKIKPYRPGWSTGIDDIPSDYAMLYDKCDLTLENRIALLKQLLGPELVSLMPKMPDGSVLRSELKRFMSQEALLLHPDNFSALLALTKDQKYAGNAWMVIKAFPVREVPAADSEQYFAQCELELQSPDVNVRKEAIRNLRFFAINAQRSQAVKLLFNLLMSNNRSMALAAKDSLTAMGPACLPELLEVISGSEPYFAVRACELIGAMGLYGQKAVPELIKILNASPDWILKTMIIKALALIKGTDAIPDIEKYVSAKQPMLAATAAQALVLLKPIPKEILNDPSDFVRNYNKPAVH